MSRNPRQRFIGGATAMIGYCRESSSGKHGGVAAARHASVDDGIERSR
jgi:hypothetical protein